MTADEIRKRFPNASTAFLRRNRDADSSGLRAALPEPHPRQALVTEARREAPRQGSRPPRYRITFTVFALRPADFDNCCAGLKWCLDAIIAAGWLPGDDWRTLEGAAISAKAAKKKDERTEIKIERIA